MSVDIQYMDHRWGTRMILNKPVELETADGFSAEAFVCNASVSGAFIRTRLKPMLLSRVFVRPMTEGAEWLDACVVRIEESGIALEWLDPGLQQISALLALRDKVPAGHAREGVPHLEAVAG